MKHNNKYEILTPNGFEDFYGVQKLRRKTTEIFFDNGISIRASHNHKVFDYDGNSLLVSNINIGDKIKSDNGYLTVIEIKKYNYKTNVFDLINSGKDNVYYTNSILSHNCNFLGSGDNVFDSNLMENIRKNMLKEPSGKMMSGAFWIWKEPVVGHKYIMGVDVSRGDSEDFTTIQIIDFDEREQVAEYVGKIPPDVAAEIAFKWGTMYNAFIVIDITGGMGVSTSRKLQELGYRDLYVDGIDYSNKWKYDPKQYEKIPGINFNSKRVQIIAAFEEYVRHGFKINSNRLYNEMNTFVYVNGRPDHQKGQHDDLIMAIAMAIYVGENSFQQLAKVENQTKVMLESWEVNTNSNASKSIAFNPMIPSGRPSTNQNPTRNDYQTYGWLFGGRR